MRRTTPPRLAARLVQWRVAAADLETVAGDLEQGYLERAASRGRIHAWWWYWREALGFLAARRRAAGSLTPAAPASSGSRIRAAAASTARDLRFGARQLRRHPSFACAAIAVMALGIGATTAVYSVLRGVLIAPLPYHAPERLVVFRATLPDIPVTPALTSLEYHALRARTDLFESVAAVVAADGNLTAPDVMAPVNAAAISDGFLETLGVPLEIGRAVPRGDVGGRRPVNISHDVWQRHFHGRPAIVGSTIEVNGAAMVVAGVLPRGFTALLGPGAGLLPQVDLFYFRGSGYDDDPFRGNVVIARLRPDVAIETAGTALATMAASLVAAHPDRYPTGPVRLSVAPLEDEVVREARPALLAAAGAVLLVLVVTCANLTNLLLARASARAREMAVRGSIGAARGDIVRQLLAEGLVVGAAGAAAGWLVALWSVEALVALAPASLPRRESIAVDAGVALFAMAAAFACAIVVSLVPAWQATRPDLAGRTKGAHAGAASRGLLVAAQIAFSVVLLVGAGLMARAFVNLRTVPLGFDAAGRASMYISLAGQPWNAGTIAEARLRRRGLYEQLAAQAAALPGVQRVGVGFPVPLSGIAMSQRVSLGLDTREREADGFIAMAGYLEALGVRLVAGRYFTAADHGRSVVVVDERLAQELWPGESAIGRRLMIVRSVSAPDWAQVVGVAGHVQARSPREAGPPQVWMSYAVRSYAQMNLVVHAADPVEAAGGIAAVAQQLGTGRPVRDVRRLEDQAADASADTRFALFVLAVLSALAVTLAAVGVYGVVAYATARRTREIALRLALGASPIRLVGRVLGGGAGWTALGVGGGLAGAAMFARSLESLLFGVAAHDALTFAAVGGFLALVSLGASLAPALRAGRVDPMLALRNE
jgi:predicted permease